MPRASGISWEMLTSPLPPNSVEQRKIGALFSSVDDLITLHQRKLNGAQRKPVRRKEGKEDGCSNAAHKFVL